MTAGRRVSPATRIAVLLGSMLLVAVPPVSADPGDEITGFGTKLWEDGREPDYKFHSGVEGWLGTILTEVLEEGWADVNTNNSDGPRFEGPIAHSDDELKFWWATSSGLSECDTAAPGWLGCGTGETNPKKVWIRSSAATHGWPLDQWCDIAETGSCPWIGRTAIHEIGHVGGHLQHYAPGIWGRTRMADYSSAEGGQPLNGEDFDEAIVLGRCDEAAMQMEYDVYSLEGGFRNCWDEVANTTQDGRLKTTLAASPSSNSACSGDPIVVSGRLHIENHASYGVIKNNNLGARSIDIYRDSQPYSTPLSQAAPLIPATTGPERSSSQ
jgi:hypothetical protein